MVLIKDAIHKNIEVSSLERRIIDTFDFQRLRRIKQLAVTNLVYPCATHTRFEHSIGTLHLCSRICQKLGLNEELAEKIRLFALLHDIGHGAFSHESEKILKRYIGSHEKIGYGKILDGEIGDIIRENFDPKQIVGISKKIYGDIVYSEIGADRIDYLLRDSHNTGVAYGVIDGERIIDKMFIDEKKKMFGILSGGLEAAESLLVGRFMMYSTVYFHPTVRIASYMLRKALVHSVESGIIEPEEFTILSDEEVIVRILNSGDEKSKSLISRILRRDLMKVAYSIEYSKIPKSAIEQIIERAKERFKGRFYVDFPESFFESYKIPIKDKGGKIYQLSKLSHLVSSLKDAEEARKRILFICDQKDREKLKKILQKLT